MDVSSIIQQPAKKFHLHPMNIDIYAQNAIKQIYLDIFIEEVIGISSIQASQLNINENENISQHLLHLKSACCELKKQIKNKQNSSIKMKDQIIFTNQKIKNIQKQRQDLENKANNLLQNVEQINIKKLATQHSFKTYQHILERMKRDDIINQKRLNLFDKSLKLLEKQQEELQKKNYSLQQFEQLSIIGLRDAHTEIKDQACNRSKKIKNMNQSLESKQILEKKKQERLYQTSIIQQMAAGDLQDADLIRIKKFLKVQFFLKAVLKAKIRRIKDYYEKYQNAFLKIKSNSNIKDGRGLKMQFFNFENNFNQSISWVKQLQEKINFAQSERTKLKKCLKINESQEIDLLQQLQKKASNQQNIKQQKAICEKASIYEFTMMKINEWLKMQQKILGLQIISGQTLNGKVQIMRKICNKMKNPSKKITMKIIKKQQCNQNSDQNKIQRQSQWGQDDNQ